MVGMENPSYGMNEMSNVSVSKGVPSFFCEGLEFGYELPSP